MYFLGKLEKLLQGDVKPVEEIVEETKKEFKKYPTKAYEKKSYNNSAAKREFTPEEKKAYWDKKNSEKAPVEKQENISDTAQPNRPAYKVYTEEEKKAYWERKNQENTQEKKEGFPKDRCYVLWAGTGNTFEAMYGDKKRVTFKLARVDAPDNNQSFHKEAKYFLDSKIKKKSVFIDFKGEEDGIQLVEVFLDRARKNSVNQMVIDEGFTKCQLPQPPSHNEHDNSQDDEYWDVPECPTEVSAPVNVEIKPISSQSKPRFPRNSK